MLKVRNVSYGSLNAQIEDKHFFLLLILSLTESLNHVISKHSLSLLDIFSHLAWYPGSESISQTHSELSGYLVLPADRGDTIEPCMPCSSPPQPAVCSTAVMLNPAAEFCRSETNSMVTSLDCDMSRGGTVWPQPEDRVHFWVRSLNVRNSYLIAIFLIRMYFM